MRYSVPFIICLLILAGCSKSGDGIPRRKAFPRIAVADSVFRAVEGLPVNFETNASAVALPDTTHTASADGSVWINLYYPQYPNAVVYCTFTPATDGKRLQEVIDNRLERISLNTGGNSSEITELTSEGGFQGRVITTHAGTVTPVQFIAFSPTMVVSGAFFMESMNNSSPDSVAPIVDAIRRDFIHTLSHLR